MTLETTASVVLLSVELKFYLQMIKDLRLHSPAERPFITNRPIIYPLASKSVFLVDE